MVPLKPMMVGFLGGYRAVTGVFRNGSALRLGEGPNAMRIPLEAGLIEPQNFPLFLPAERQP